MEYKIGKYKYFDILVYINMHYFPSELGENIREDNEFALALYNQLLEDFFMQILSEIELNEVCRKILDLTGFIWYRQPFFDGNTRTLRVFIKLIFYLFDYDIDLQSKEYEQFIPIFYQEDEKCDNHDIEKLKRRLTKIE